MLNGSSTTLLREGNNWDVFLNYFYAIFFILCLLIGVVLNPFIIVYHAKQKKTFAKFMFLLVSSIDQFKLIYFPLILVPKLLSPLEDKDYYITYNPTSVPWTAYTNCFVVFFVWFETDALVILSVSRYLSIAHPMSKFKRKNCFLATVLLLSCLKWISASIGIQFLQKELLYSRIYDALAYTTYTGP